MSAGRLLLRIGGVLVLLLALIGFLRIGTDDNSGTSVASSGVQPGEVPCGAGPIVGAGSTFAKNIQLQWIQDYLRACPNAPVNYNATGSGAGIQAFIDAQVDFAGTDTVMKDDEQQAADARCAGGTARHYPIAAGALVFTYNVPGVDELRLSPPVLADVFTGRLTRWDDPRIAADNPGVRLPSIAIQAVHRSDSSGTTDVFSRFLDATAGPAWTLGTGKELRWPTGGLAAKGSDGVTQAVQGAPGAITYLEESYAVTNQLPTALLGNTAGEFVAPEAGAVSAALSAAEVDRSAGDVRVEVDYTSTTPGIYPAASVTYAVVCDEGGANTSSVKAYLGYALGRGQVSAAPLGYAPLPPAISGAVTPEIAALV